MTAVHPEFAAHGSFAHLKLGRNDRRVDVRTLQFARYADDAELMPAIPGNHDGDNSDDPSVRSLDAFVANFCATSPVLTPDASDRSG